MFPKWEKMFPNRARSRRKSQKKKVKICICGREFKTRGGLWKHKKTCDEVGDDTNVSKCFQNGNKKRRKISSSR